LHASAIFALNPDLLRVLPEGARFLPYAVPPVGPVGGIGPIPDKERPVLAHAPSHRGVKGTRFLLEAVNRLREEGVRFDFMLIEGVPHEEAMRRYAHADLFVDQLLAGWYGGVAVELMALRKPVVCYLREADLQVIPPAMQAQIPIIQATPSTIYEVLKRWLTTPRSELASRGALGPAFVSRWHDPRAIAELTRETYLRITGAQLGTAAAA
jgi:glycosyltransferase involved in cell wall biosynthesis